MSGIGQWPAEVEECIVTTYADQIADKVAARLIEGAFHIPQDFSDALAKSCPGNWYSIFWAGPGPYQLQLEFNIVPQGRIQLTLRDVSGCQVWKAELRP